MTDWLTNGRLRCWSHYDAKFQNLTCLFDHLCTSVLKNLGLSIIDNVSCQCAVCFLHPDVLEMPPGKRMTAALSNLAINLSSSLLLDIYALQKKLDLWLHGPHAHLQGWTQFQQAYVCEYAITNSEFRFLDYWCTEFKQICQSKCLLKPFHLQERCIEGWNLNSPGTL